MWGDRGPGDKGLDEVGRVGAGGEGVADKGCEVGERPGVGKCVNWAIGAGVEGGVSRARWM